MTDTKQVLPGILSQAQAADLSAIRSFLTTNPSEPLVATGYGGSESASDFAALNFSDGDRNEARKLFIKAGSDKSFTIPMPRTHEGFVSTGPAFSYFSICPVYGLDPTSPKNPGRIDKRVPMWVPFIAEMKKNRPLSI